MFDFVAKHKRLIQLVLALTMVPFAFFGLYTPCLIPLIPDETENNSEDKAQRKRDNFGSGEHHRKRFSTPLTNCNIRPDETI